MAETGQAGTHAPQSIALRRVDVELGDIREISFILPRMNTIHGADIHACRILRADTRLCNYIGHFAPLLSKRRKVGAAPHGTRNPPVISGASPGGEHGY